MIKLEHIKKNNQGEILCDAYLEDCKTALPLVLDTKRRCFNDFVFPAGYEDCGTHIAMAKFRLLEMFDENKLKDRVTIMWY